MRTLLLLTVLLVSYCTVAQTPVEHYQITNLGTTYSQQQIEASINGADLCGFYYQTSERELHFNDGTVVTIFAANSLQGISGSCISPQYVNHQNEIWEIAANGYLIRRIATQPTK